MAGRKLVPAIGMFLVVALAATGCARRDVTTVEPSDAKRETLAFLRDAMEQVRLPWPDRIREPIPIACSLGGDGVRFQYLVHVRHSQEAEELARAFEHHWAAKGLEVIATHGELGKYGTIYSATARGASGPRGSFDVSRARVALYAESACFAGRVADYDL